MVYGKRVPRPGVIERVRWFWQLQGKQKREKTQKVLSESLGSWFLLLFSIFPEQLDWQKASRGPAGLKAKKWTSEALLGIFFSLPSPVHWFQLLKTWIKFIWTLCQAEISFTVCSAYHNFPIAVSISKQSMVYIKSILVKQNGLRD